MQDDSVPGRKEVAHQLRAEIERGDYGRSGKLPSENELAARLQVSRNTLREALQDLAAAEEVEPRHRYGWYVRAERRRNFPLRPANVADPGLDVWGTFGRREGLAVRDPASVDLVSPPRRVREALELDDDRCYARQCMREAQNPETGAWECWAVSTSYWPQAVADGSPLSEIGADVDLLDPAGVAAASGYPLEVHHDVVSARPAEESEAEVLGLSIRSYVLDVLRASRTAEGIVVCALHDVLDPRRFRLTIDDEAAR